MLGRLSDEAVRASIAPTLRAMHAEPSAAWVRQVLAQLVAVVEHVDRRGPDPSGERRAALAAALSGLSGNPLVPADGSPEARAAAALAAAAGDATADAAAAAEVRAALRPVLVGELDAELASTMELMDGFRGRVRDA